MYMNKPYEEIYAPSTMEGSEGLLAIIVRANYVPPTTGAMFFTPGEFPQQLGILCHREGTIIPTHVHRVERRSIDVTQEVLLVRRGKMHVSLYTSKGDLVAQRMIEQGDIIMLCGGGHGFEVKEDSLIAEIKQGPYLGKGDKMSLTPRT